MSSVRTRTLLIGVAAASAVTAVSPSIGRLDVSTAVAAAVLVLVVAGIAAATSDISPMSALFLCVAAMVCVTEIAATTSLEYTAESLTAGSTVLLTAALGFVTASVLGSSSAEADDVNNTAAHPTPRVRMDALATSEIAR